MASPASSGYDGAKPDVQALVTQTTGDVLAVSVDADRSFVAQGGDSLTALAFAESVGDKLGIEVPLEVVFDADDLNDLARQLAERLDTPADSAGA